MKLDYLIDLFTDRPSMPGKPQPTDVLESVVSLHWEPSEDDGGCEITCYIVEYNRVRIDLYLYTYLKPVAI
jgi:hypothetical protein